MIWFIVQFVTFFALPTFASEVLYELESGRFSVSHWDDEGNRIGVEFVDIRGTFTARLSQSHIWTMLDISEIDFQTVDSEYRIRGEGFWGVAANVRKEDGLPVSGFGDFRLDINQCLNIPFSIFEPSGLNDSPEVAIFSSGSKPALADGITVSFFLSVVAVPSGSERLRFFRRGDCNGDATRNLTDVVCFLNYLFDFGQTPTCLDAADASDDGSLDLADAVTVLNYLFLDGSIPPLPNRLCGIDTTDDDLDCGGQRACLD